jgi:hypothetical protein
LRRRCSLLVFFLFMPSLLNSRLDRRGNRTMGAKARCEVQGHDAERYSK